MKVMRLIPAPYLIYEALEGARRYPINFIQLY